VTVLTPLQLAVDNHTKVLVRVYSVKLSLSEGVGIQDLLLLVGNLESFAFGEIHSELSGFCPLDKS